MLMMQPVDNELVLQLDLEPGQNADAVVAAEALIAWIAAVREASAVMDPLGTVAVDLVSAEPACLRFRTALRFIEQKVLGPPADALNEFPRIKKLVSASVIGMPAGLVLAGTAMLVLPDQTVKLSDEGRKTFEEQRERVAQTPSVQAKVQTFYGTVKKNRAITGISVAEKADQPPIVAVSRTEFDERSGLWLPQEPEAPTRSAGGIWDVVVTHPVAIGEPRVWGFMRDGLPFRAKVVDETFLSAIRNRTLHLEVQEGVMLRVQVSYLERLNGQTWEPVSGSWQIPKVITPSPSPSSAPLPFFGKP